MVCSTMLSRGTSRAISASACALARASVPSTSPRLGAERGAQHAQHGPRVLPPARRRQLGLAHGAVAVELEEALERAARRPLGDGVEPGRRLALDRRARLGLAPREGRDVHDADARARALEVADAARERLRQALGVDRGDALEHRLEREVRAERARRAT